MKPSALLALALALFPAPALWAVPAQVENAGYKVTISETLPGIDSQSILPPGAAITVSVQDKFRSTITTYPIQAYAINDYSLLGDSLNLVGRTTLVGSQQPLRYSLTQLALSNPQDSRQFQNLKKFSLSPDNQNLLAVIDQGEGKSGLVGVIRLGNSPASVDWIYAEPGQVNQFKAAFAGPVTDFILQDPVGWAADSESGAFLFSVENGVKDAQGQPVLKDYLADLELGDKGWAASAQAVDLSAYHYHNGAVVTDLRCSDGKIALFITSDSNSNPVEVDFKPAPR